MQLSRRFGTAIALDIGVNTIAAKEPKLLAVNDVSLFLSYNRKKKIGAKNMINERTNEEMEVLEIEVLEEIIAPGIILGD
jgi:hypothetical protein